MEGMENRRTLRGLVSPGCSDSMQCPSSDVSCSLSKLSNAMQARTVTRHEYSSIFFFFLSLALLPCFSGTPLPWQVVALIPQSPFGGRATARVHHPDVPPKFRHMFRESIRFLFFANWLVSIVSLFSKSGIVPETQLIKFFPSLSHPPPPLPPYSFASGWLHGSQPT